MNNERGRKCLIFTIFYRSPVIGLASRLQGRQFHHLAIVHHRHSVHELGRADYFFEAVQAIWATIQQPIVDQVNGEWFMGRRSDGSLVAGDKVELWKTPYHNSRSCLEILRWLS